MKFIRSYYTIIAIALFIFFLAIADIVAPNYYHISKDAISALGAQGYERKIIMQLGFLSFGMILSTGIIINRLSWRTSPFLIYAVSIAMTGIFCAKPLFDTGFTYSETQSMLHSVFAQLAAVTLGTGILIQMIFSTERNRKIAHLVFLLLLTVIVLAMKFELFINYQGVAQRILFLISFIWLIRFPPRGFSTDLECKTDHTT